MYPRLVLARELLREDGVIFISIDDHEAHNLKQIMNEIFGEEGFVASFIWEKHKAPKNDNKYITINHDYILMFCKDKSSYRQILLSRSEENIDSFTNPDNDSRGVWSPGPLLGPTFSSNSIFTIISPFTQKETLPPNGKCLAFSSKKIAKLISDNRIWFGKDGNNAPQIKRFLSELRDGIVPMSMLLHDDIGGNQVASNDLQNLFDGKKIFDYPKPVSLIKRILQISTQPNDIILDFFAGSGTTGQAVMELNQEEIEKKEKQLKDNAKENLFENSRESSIEDLIEEKKAGGRKFILVQFPEKINQKKSNEAFKFVSKLMQYRGIEINDKNPPTISEITIERIKRASEKYQKVDNGFKVFKLTENKLEKELFAGLLNKTNEDIFTHLALFYGYGLSYKIEKISSKEIYLIKAEFKNIRNAIVILEKEPLKQEDILNLVKNI